MNKNFKQLAKNVIDIEHKAIAELLQFIDDSFELACEFMFACKGRVIVIGMGKSGHIAGKIAATLASTGTPAFFVHPGEASHGDLGMITANDVVLTISNSGETTEVLAITPVIKRIGAKLISMTGNKNSTLARLADTHICIKITTEACPLGLAPTSSTTAALVMGDALAVALLNARDFTADDFALSHPGGNLGKRLLLRIDDIMHKDDRILDIPSSCQQQLKMHLVHRVGDSEMQQLPSLPAAASLPTPRASICGQSGLFRHEGAWLLMSDVGS